MNLGTDYSSDLAPRVIEVAARADRGRSEEHNLEFEARWNELYNTPHDNGDTLVIGAIGDADSLNDLTALPPRTSPPSKLDSEPFEVHSKG